MTPKEKAEDIINGFYLCMPFKDVKLTSCLENPDLIIKMERLSAKQCALICVDEIINSDEEEHPSDIKIEFWHEVKSELEKL